MSLFEKAYAHIAKNPGANAAQIAAATGATKSAVATALTNLFRAGRVRREQGGLTRGTPFYAYWLAVPTATPQTEPTTPAPKIEVVPKPEPVVVKPPIMPRETAAESLDTLAEKLAASVVSTIVAAIVNRITSEVKAQLPAALAGLESDLSKELLGYKAPDKAQLRSVLILGLLPQQAGMIAVEFNECFDLRFWKDEQSHKLTAMAKAADFVVVMTGKSSHSAIETLKAAGVSPRYVRGGMTTLREHLTNLYVTEEV